MTGRYASKTEVPVSKSKTEIKKQIGNAGPCRTAEALVRAQFEEAGRRRAA